VGAAWLPVSGKAGTGHFRFFGKFIKERTANQQGFVDTKDMITALLAVMVGNRNLMTVDKLQLFLSNFVGK